MSILLKKNPWILLSLIQSIAGLRLVQLYKQQNKKLVTIYGITTYLVDVIEKNDISLTEFDAIVLQDLGVRVTVVEES